MNFFTRNKPTSTLNSTHQNDNNVLPTNEDLSVFVVLQKDNKFYIHNTNNKPIIKNKIIENYKVEGALFDDVSMMKESNGTTESFNIEQQKKSFADINPSHRFGAHLRSDSTESNGGKPPSHPKYKKRTTSQKRRKLNIKTLKQKS